MISLERLIDAGLFQLYPELKDADGRKRWTERVRKLRQIWSAEQKTTDREIELALQVACNCFAQLGRADIASILLAFKHRKYSSLIAKGECISLSTIISRYVSKLSNNLAQSNSQRPKWANKPEEVRRYWVTSEAIKSYSKLPDTQFQVHLQQHQDILRRIYS